MAQSQNRRNTWEGPNGRSAEAKATELLHLYIYDYCKKKKFVQAARAFSSEANVPTDQVPPFESSTGFLADWWSVFWDIYFAKSKEAEASKEANIMDEYHSFLRTKKEEVLQQQRAFNLQQAQQQAQQQQQQQAQAQQQAQLQAQQQAQQQAQRRASEAQRAAQSPQLSVHQQQQQQDQQQTPHLQQQSVPSQQQQQQQQAQQQQQQQLSRDVRPSPASSTASLPNNNGMPPPPNNNNNIVNTPQSMPANLPQQHIPGRHTASPSFSPQQLQRGVEVVPGGGGPHPPQPQPSNLGPEGMMTSPMVNQQMPMQQSMMTAAHRAQQQSAIVNAAMNSVGLGGRDQSSLTHEEKIILQNQIRKISMNQQMNMMRNNPMLANNPQAQARLQMQQQAILQQQQQAQQQAMLQQQHLQQQQQQQQHAQQQQGMPPQHAQQQQQPQGTPQQQHQMQQQQGTPQQQQAQLPPHTPQQQHPMGQSPQVDPAQRMGPAGPPVNGQPRPHMVGPGGQMGMNPNMQSPNLMNGGIPFNGDVNLMLAQQMMNKGQMPAGLTPQQQQQHQQQMLVAQQQRAIMNQRRMMQQQQAQQAQQAQQQQQQQQQQNQGAGPQQQQQPPLPPSSAGGQPHSQQPTPQQQPQQLPPGQGANGGPQTPPNMGSPNPAAIPGSGSPEGGDKKKNIAVALYQRRQVHHAMQQQQQAQQQAQFAHPPPQKRQRTNNGEDASATTPQQMQQSPQLQHKMSPHVMNAQQQPNPNESPVMAMQQRLAAQQRSQFEQQQQQQQQMNSPQLTRNSISGTPQQQQQQLHQQQRMSWNPDMDSPMNDMQSPANNMNNPGGMAAAANAAAAAAAANVAAQNNNNNNNAMSNSNVLSFDLERFMMGDSGDFGEMFAAGDENPDQNLLMGGDGADLDPFGGGFLASMGGGLDLDNGMTGNNGASGGAPASHAINMNANTALQPYADLPGHTNKVSTAAFSIDGQWLASAGHDRKVMIWSVQDKKTLYTLDGHTGNITCARWSSDNRNLVATTSYDKTLRIWDVGSALAALASKDDKDDDDPKTDSTTPNPKQLAKWDCRAQVTAVDFAPDRPDTICSLDAEGELKVWNLNTSNCEKSLKMTQSKSGFAPNPMRFHPRTASVLACAVGNQINIIDITSSGKNNSGNSNNNNSNNIINADNMGVRTIPTDHGKNICSFDWSSDGNFLVASSEDKICVYETSHWKCVMNHIPQSKISGCAFVNGGNEKLRLLYGGYQDIFLWQCGIPGAQPKKVGSQSGMVVSIACCSVASCQTLVASASHHQKEKNLMLWTI